jgi:hypothetical protein
MKYITSDPAILSGMPVIVGTRVPVARILSLLKEEYLLEEILWWSHYFGHREWRLEAQFNFLLRMIKTRQCRNLRIVRTEPHLFR